MAQKKNNQVYYISLHSRANTMSSEKVSISKRKCQKCMGIIYKYGVPKTDKKYIICFECMLWREDDGNKSRVLMWVESAKQWGFKANKPKRHRKFHSLSRDHQDKLNIAHDDYANKQCDEDILGL